MPWRRCCLEIDQAHLAAEGEIFPLDEGNLVAERCWPLK